MDEDDTVGANIRAAVAERQSGLHGDIRTLVREELKSLKEDYPDRGPDVEWLNTMRLDEDDWILRQIFDMSGLDRTQLSHWRLLLGILAEHYIDPDAPDTFERKYSPAAIAAYKWDDAELERLFDEAAELARQHQSPRWTRPRICKELAKQNKFKRADESRYEASTLVSKLNEILDSKQADRKSGRLDGDPVKKADVELKLSYFRFNKKTAS